MNEAIPLTLTYDSFAHFWKALVSRRKAKRLDIDREQAWAQLQADGISAPFLRADAARQEAKNGKKTGDRSKKDDRGPKDARKRQKVAVSMSRETAKSARKTPKTAARKAALKRRQTRRKAATSSKPQPAEDKKQ